MNATAMPTDDPEERVSDFQYVYSAAVMMLILCALCPLARSVYKGCCCYWVRNNFRGLVVLESQTSCCCFRLRFSPAVAPEDDPTERLAAAAVAAHAVRRSSVPAAHLAAHSREQTECPVCLGLLGDDPLILACGHCFDPPCIEKWFRACVESDDKARPPEQERSPGARVVVVAAVRPAATLTCPLCKSAARPPHFRDPASPTLPRPPPRPQRDRPSRVRRV